MPSSQIELGLVCFQAVHKTLLYRQLRMFLKNTLYLTIYHMTIIDFSPGDQAIVGRILCQESDFHNCRPYKQTLLYSQYLPFDN